MLRSICLHCMASRCRFPAGNANYGVATGILTYRLVRRLLRQLLSGYAMAYYAGNHHRALSRTATPSACSLSRPPIQWYLHPPKSQIPCLTSVSHICLTYLLQHFASFSLSPCPSTLPLHFYMHLGPLANEKLHSRRNQGAYGTSGGFSDFFVCKRWKTPQNAKNSREKPHH